MNKNNNDYKLSLAEFRGRVISDLEHIKGEITEIKSISLQNRDDIVELKKWKATVIAYASAFGAGAGVIINLLRDYL